MCFVYLPFLQPLNLSSLFFIYYILSSLSSLKFGTFETQYYCYLVLEIITNTKILCLSRFLMVCAWLLRLCLRNALFWISTQQVVV
jgi:hypothetical protein